MPTAYQYSKADEIENDIATSPKPTAYEISQGYPLNMLGDRQFECLVHDLFLAEARSRTSTFGSFDQALLMQGVGERGRDCALLLDRVHVGVIQCKRYDALLTKPDVAREILKFCLHAIVDPELMPQAKNFRYIFAASRDFNEKAKLLLASFNVNILSEPALLPWCKEVIEVNKQLEHLKPEEVEAQLRELLSEIKVTPLAFNELSTMLVRDHTVVAKYFSVKTVVSEERLLPIEAKLETITRMIADEDVRRLVDDLQKHPQDRRHDMGLVSLWGYPKEFVGRLHRDGKLMALVQELSIAKAKFDDEFYPILIEEMSEAIFVNITATGRFSPFTIQAARPYLFDRLSERWLRAQQGDAMASIIMRSVTAAADPLAIRARLLETGEAVLRGDFSQVVGDEELVALNKKVLISAHRSLRNRADMERTFDKDWPAMLPLLKKIEQQLDSLLSDNTTIVLGGMKWVDSSARIKDVFKAIDSLKKTGD